MSTSPADRSPAGTTPMSTGTAPGRAAPRIGFVAQVDHQDLEAGRALFRAAEGLGYDAGYVRVRHLQQALSSPLLFLAALGQHTERIARGTAVYGRVVLDEPVAVAQALLADPVVLEADEITLVLPAGSPLEDSTRILDAFARHVLPPSAARTALNEPFRPERSPRRTGRSDRSLAPWRPTSNRCCGS